MSRVVTTLLVAVVMLFVKGTVVTPGAPVPPLAQVLTALEPVQLVPTGVKISGASSTDEICLFGK